MELKDYEAQRARQQVELQKLNEQIEQLSRNRNNLVADMLRTDGAIQALKSMEGNNNKNESD